MVEKQFVVGVADAFLRDKKTNQIVLKAKSLLSSAIQQTVQNTEIAGGFGNKLLFDWCYGKRLNATLESATWNEEYLAISNGASIVTGTQDFYVFDESVTLASGNGVVAQTPVGDLYVQQANGTYVTVTPTGSSFMVAGGGNTTVKVTYRAAASVNQVAIAANEYPSTYELVLKSQIFGQSGSKIADLEIVIPEYKPNGAHEITFGAASASTSKMEGKALAYDAPGGKEVYAYVNIKPVHATASYVAIAATPASVSLSAGGQARQVAVYGIQGGLRSNVVITPASAGTTYASSATGVATVSADGLITPIAAGNATITVTNGSLTDTVAVTVA